MKEGREGKGKREREREREKESLYTWIFFVCHVIARHVWHCPCT